MLTLLAWQLFPQVRVFAHPIYLEWAVCLAAFFAVAAIDSQKITASKQNISIRS